MSLTSNEIAHLNKMNKAAQDVSLGTLVNGFVNNAMVSGSVIATASQSLSLIHI